VLLFLLALRGTICLQPSSSGDGLRHVCLVTCVQVMSHMLLIHVANFAYLAPVFVCLLGRVVSWCHMLG
jgi:hypothetical protein